MNPYSRHSIARTTVLPILLALITMLFINSCDKAGYEPANISGVIWGTTYTITYDPDECESRSAVEKAVAEALASVDSAANAFSPVSQVAVLNRAGRLVQPSPALVDILSASIRLNADTRGAFDPTVSPLVNLWGFGPDDRREQVDKEQVDSAMVLVGMDKVRFCGDSVLFERDGMRLDFGAIAKGYAVDRVAGTLRQCGSTNFIVEIGGEVRVNGVSPRGDRWNVQIDAPVADLTGSHTRLAVLAVTDVSMATSGNYRNYITGVDGRWYAHTISPFSGCPIQTDILSATVFCRDAMTADALATASMVLGLDEATAMIDRLRRSDADGVCGAVFVTRDADGRFVIHPVAIDSDRIAFLD